MNFKIIEENLTWEEAKDKLCKGLFLSHKLFTNEWITINDNDDILDFNGELSDYDEWWYLHRGEIWETGFILMELK